jgi:hypothetical protein
MLKLGSDPEIFAHNGTHVVPAFYALGGDIEVELPFGKAYCDGAAIEFTVQPSDNPTTVAQNIWSNIFSLCSFLQERGYKPSLISNAYVGRYIPQLPKEYGTRASLQILGCQADVRVYSWGEDIRRPDPKEYPYRTIGTHIHLELGALAKNWPYVQFLTAYLDALLGTAGIYLLEGDQPAKDRNKLYGKSGTIRVKTKEKDGYDGVEYRTLPTQSVLSSQIATHTFFEMAELVRDVIFEIYTNGGFSALRDGLGGVEGMKNIAQAIDAHNSKECRRLAKLVSDRIGLYVHQLENLIIPDNYELGG